MNARLEHLRRRRAAVIASLLRRQRRDHDIGGRFYAYARIERALYRAACEESAA